MDRDDRGPAPDHRTAEMEERAISAPSQIGEALWRGRLRMGLSLDDVARRLPRSWHGSLSSRYRSPDPDVPQLKSTSAGRPAT